MKACYCLRCFYGESFRQAKTLRLSFAPAACRATVIILLTLLLELDLLATFWQNERCRISVLKLCSGQQLDSAIENILAYPEYAWRMPRKTSGR